MVSTAPMTCLGRSTSPAMSKIGALFFAGVGVAAVERSLSGMAMSDVG